MTGASFTAAEKDMLIRLSVADHHRRTGGAAGWVHVAAPARAEALLSVARRGLARCWWGDGEDAGLLLGEATPAGLKAAEALRP